MALAEEIQEAGLVVIRLIGVLQAPEASVGNHVKRLIAVSPGNTGRAMDIVRKLDLSLGLQLRKVVAAHLEARRDSRFAGDVLHIMERIADSGAGKSTGRRCVVELKVRVMFVGVIPALRQPKL
jgi:hypothetical protein